MEKCFPGEGMIWDSWDVGAPWSIFHSLNPLRSIRRVRCLRRRIIQRLCLSLESSLRSGPINMAN